MDNKGRKLHAQAAQAREKGEFLESLDFNDQALLTYDADNDALGFAEGIACRSITLRVYANLHNSKRILTLVKFEMLAAVAIARESEDKQALILPLYNLAQVQEDLSEIHDAVKTYKESLDIISSLANLSSPSQIANMKVHMAVCEYKAGDKAALERALHVLQQLEEANEQNKYNKDVWISGGYMRLANALRADNISQAKEYLQKAKEIIGANPELIVRKQQWEKLALSVNT